MSIVTEFSWEKIADPTFGGDRQPTPDLEAITCPEREAFRAAVAQVAAKAQATLPECNGCVEKAVALVLAGDVTLQPDGSALVGSQCAPDTVYHVVGGKCPCKDFAQAPHQFCKHRLASAIHQRALTLTTQAPAQSAAAEKRALITERERHSMEQLTDERRDQILQGLLAAMRLLPDGMRALASVIETIDKDIFNLREYVVHVEGLIRDWYATLLQVYPPPAPPPTDSSRTTDTTTPYPRSPIELAVLEALAARGSTGASPLELSRHVPYPRAEIATTLRALVTLGTVDRYYHGSYRLWQPGSKKEGPPASREDLLQRLSELTPPPPPGLHDPTAPPAG